MINYPSAYSFQLKLLPFFVPSTCLQCPLPAPCWTYFAVVRCVPGVIKSRFEKTNKQKNVVMRCRVTVERGDAHQSRYLVWLLAFFVPSVVIITRPE